MINKLWYMYDFFNIYIIYIKLSYKWYKKTYILCNQLDELLAKSIKWYMCFDRVD